MKSQSEKTSNNKQPEKTSNNNNQNSDTNKKTPMHDNNQNTVVKGPPRKTVVHDVSHVVNEEFNKLMSDSHSLSAKYHSYLQNIKQSETITIKFYDELKVLRRQTLCQIMSALEKLLPQFDQLENTGDERKTYTQHIIAYLEYLKLEFIRNRYLVDSFSFDSMQKSSEKGANKDDSKTNYLSNGSSILDESDQIKNDVNEIDKKLMIISQKYFTFIPDIEEIKITNKRHEKSISVSTTSTARMLAKCKLICCLCSPKYL